MTTSFQEDRLLSALSSLPRGHKVAFAASCAERLAPSYTSLARISRLRGAPALLSALDACWRLCLKDRPDDQYAAVTAALDALLAEIEGGPWNALRAVASDAIACLIYTVECARQDSAQHAVFAARRAYEAVDGFVSERDDIQFDQPDSEARIRQDPIVKRESEKQQQDLEVLTKRQRLDEAFLLTLRTDSARIGAELARTIEAYVSGERQAPHKRSPGG